MKIVVAGYYGFGNVGDELILSTIVKEFRRTHPGDRLIVLSHNPEDTRRQHGVEAVNRWHPIDVMKALAGANRFILGGGGLFQDKTSIRSLLYYAGLLFLAQQLSQSTALYSVSFETIRFWLGRKVLVGLLKNRRTTICVRDSESRESLLSWGIPANRILTTPDSVFLLGLIPQSSRPKAEKKLLFIPRFPCPLAGHELYRSILRELDQKNIPTQIALFHPQQELEVWQDFKKKLSASFEVVEWHHPSQIMDITSESRGVISARFHGLVLAELAGVPCWGIGSKDKAGRFCREWKRPFLGWGHSSSEVSEELNLFLNTPDPLRNQEFDLICEKARTAFGDVFSPPVGNT